MPTSAPVHLQPAAAFPWWWLLLLLLLLVPCCCLLIWRRRRGKEEVLLRFELPPPPDVAAEPPPLPHRKEKRPTEEQPQVPVDEDDYRPVRAAKEFKIWVLDRFRRGDEDGVETMKRFRGDKRQREQAAAVGAREPAAKKTRVPLVPQTSAASQRMLQEIKKT